MKSIAIFIDYFGQWPEWLPLFLESCKWNSTISWFITGDDELPDIFPPNVHFTRMSKTQYCAQVEDRLGVSLTLNDAYKICELRPMYGVLHRDVIGDFDFFGYGDLDVIYGDLRSFYDDRVLCSNTISTHSWCLSGHLTLIRNEEWLRLAFDRLPGWKNLISDSGAHRFDEDFFRFAFMYPVGLPLYQRVAYDILDPDGVKYRQGHHWVEQYTTPLTRRPWINGESHHPEVWYWKSGLITNCQDGGRTFPYLHFMNFKSPRYLHSRYCGRAPWENRQPLLAAPIEDLMAGFQIDFEGFKALS